MIIAISAIGEHYLGEQRAAMAAFTFGLLVTFLGVRINTRLIRAKVSWWFHDIESEGGVHVHHMVIGVVLMVAMGIALIATTPTHLWLQLCALVFGAGVALDARRVRPDPAPAGRLLEGRGTDLGGRRDHRRVRRPALHPRVQAGRDRCRSDVGRRRGRRHRHRDHRLLQHVLGRRLSVQGQVLDGVLRRVHPHHRRRRGAAAGAARLALGAQAVREEAEEARQRPAPRGQADRTWRAWREAFFDLIAGKPHLPSLAAGGRAGGAVADAVAR